MNPIRRFYKTSPRLRRLTRQATNAAISGVTNGALWLIGRLSLEQALWLAERTGALLFLLLRDTRRLALEHLQMAFGDTLTRAAREDLARASLINVARTFCEVAKIDTIRARRDEYFDFEGGENLKAMLAEGKGTIAITGHIGNWELLAAYFAWTEVPVAAIARRIYADKLNQLLVDYRRRQGVETILRESPSSGREIVRALKRKGILAMLIDQDTHVPSVSVPFFGRPARTPVGAAALALRRQIPVFAAFIQRRPQGGHRITISPPIRLPSRAQVPSVEHADVHADVHANVQADVRALTQEFNAALEAQIRSNPAEWVWWHERWRRTPIPHLDLDEGFQYTSDDTVSQER